MLEILEAERYRYPSKKLHAEAIAEWLEDKSVKWNLYALTAVFQDTDIRIPRIPCTPARWESEYHKRVLGKFRKRLITSKLQQEKAIPVDFLFYYEKEHAGLGKITGSQSPHHVHALVPIPKELDHRIWVDEVNLGVLPKVWSRKEPSTLHPRLRKDLNSVDTLQDMLFEEVHNKKTLDWLNYIAKCKQI